MIKDTLPIILNEKDTHAGKINVGPLYKKYIRSWSEKPSYYQKLSPEQKLTFSKKLAWEMWNSKKERVHFSELYPHVFNLSPGQMHDLGRLQDAVDTVRDASFLIRDNAGNYRFSHRSFMEAFLAWEILDNINAGNTDVFSTQILSREVVISSFTFRGNMRTKNLKMLRGEKHLTVPCIQNPLIKDILLKIRSSPHAKRSLIILTEKDLPRMRYRPFTG